MAAKRPGEDSKPTKAKTFGTPFPKGVSGNPGGLPREVLEIRRRLLSFWPDACAQLEQLIKSGVPDLIIEGLKLYFKHALPAWKETPDEDSLRDMPDEELVKKAREVLRLVAPSSKVTQ